MGSKPALLLSLMLLSGADGLSAAPPKDIDRLQGEWTMVSGRVNGVESVVRSPDGMRCVVRGGDVRFLHDGKVVEQVTIKLDSSKMPKAIDATLESKDVAPGIYSLESGTFTLCYTGPGQERPRDFEARAGSGHKLSVWKRPAKGKDSLRTPTAATINK